MQSYNFDSENLIGSVHNELLRCRSITVINFEVKLECNQTRNAKTEIHFSKIITFCSL